MHCLFVFYFKFFFQPDTAWLKNCKLYRHTFDDLRHVSEIVYASPSVQGPFYSSIEHDKTKLIKLLLKVGSPLSDASVMQYNYAIFNVSGWRETMKMRVLLLLLYIPQDFHWCISIKSILLCYRIKALPRFHNYKALTEPYHDRRKVLNPLFYYLRKSTNLVTFFFIPTVSFKKENALICELLQT